MWLGLLIVAIMVAAVLGVAGAGIYAVPIVLLGVFGALFLFMRQGAEVAKGTPPRATDSPQDTEHQGRFARTGYAHPGQENMTPEQMASGSDRR